jgi:hypothetical protein
MRKIGVDEQQPSYLPETTEKPFAGMVVEWYHQREVVLYRLTAISMDVVENWAKYVLQTLETWDKNKPYLAVHDLSQPGISLQYAALVNFDMTNIGITGDGRVLAELLVDQHPEFKALVAVNFNLSLSGQTNRTLISFLNRIHPSIQYKTFYNRTKCIRWLLNGGVADTQELRPLARKTASSDDNPKINTHPSSES